ncbi:ABC transporter ATP-binding protein [Mycoplasmopsis felis]|uniref:ABC transporter ATP-binding protein n=1 Tax=Mycoplasmopsis felis TaxID=33923 RepID=UPI003A4D6DEE
MLKMFKILPKQLKKQLFLGICLVLLNVILTMFIPILISQFLPLLIEKRELYKIVLFNNEVYKTSSFSNALVLLLGLTVSLIIVSSVISITSLLLIVWAGEKASNFYRDTLFKKYQLLSLKDIAHFTPESLITRINDDVAVFWDFLVSASTSLVKSPFYIIAGLVFAFLTDVNLTFSIIAVIPLLVLVMGLIFKKVRPLISQNRKNLDAITKESDENILGIRFIKAYNLQNQQYKKFKNINTKWKNTEISVFNLFSAAMPSFFFIVNLVVVFIYATAYLMIQNQPDLDYAQLVAKINTFIEYEFIIALGITTFSQFLGTFFRARVSSKRVIDVIETKYDDLLVTNGLNLSNDSNYSIEFKNFNFKYFDTSEDYVLKDINFKIPAGHTLGIIGPTGSGKSTIANLLVNNMKYNDGNILIENKEVKEINSKQLRENIGIVYQDSLLYSGTIKSNLLFAKTNANEDEIQKAINNACANSFINSFPDKLDHIIGQRGKNLSGGQKQRLSIARTLLINPKILILDDSTSALDNITTKNLIQNIKNNYNTTNIIISQKINSIKHADNIIVLDKGRIIAQGTHQELIKNCPWYQDVNNNQLEQ